MSSCNLSEIHDHKLSRPFRDQCIPKLGIVEQQSDYQELYKTASKEVLDVIRERLAGRS